MTLQNEHRLSTIRTAGLLCFWTAVLGAASGVFLAFIEPVVPESQWSYPLDVGAFTVIQVWFAVQHLGLLLGLMALRWTGALGLGTPGRIAQIVAVACMAAFAAAELAAIAAAADSQESALAGLLGVAYGIISVVLGAALIVAGMAVLRARVWKGWRRLIPLALGLWVFVPMLPALALSFTGARFAIAGWMLLFAALGWALVRPSAAPERVQAGSGQPSRSRHPSWPNPAP
ncbi:hypothetical protein [Pseudarthrobacter sp. DSP2-3-2b1]|uniref:hypothetical protein n=1 Tax=Pseudarthrobacter sp. DSP2-3-2b1 TaxID=2804661 RepID=UPI003CF0EA11